MPKHGVRLARFIAIVRSSLTCIALACGADLASANPYSICEPNCGGSWLDLVIGLILIGGLFAFGWLLWGKASIRWIYGPTVLGTLAILIFKPDLGSKPNKWIYLPFLGIFVGWVLVFLAILLFDALTSNRDRH